MLNATNQYDSNGMEKRNETLFFRDLRTFFFSIYQAFFQIHTWENEVTVNVQVTEQKKLYIYIYNIYNIYIYKLSNTEQMPWCPNREALLLVG